MIGFITVVSFVVFEAWVDSCVHQHCLLPSSLFTLQRLCVCFSFFLRIGNGGSSGHHESSFSAFPWLISLGKFSRCFLAFSNGASSWSSLWNIHIKTLMQSQRNGCRSCCFLYFFFHSAVASAAMRQRDYHCGDCEMPSKQETEGAAS